MCFIQVLPCVYDHYWTGNIFDPLIRLELHVELFQENVWKWGTCDFVKCTQRCIVVCHHLCVVDELVSEVVVGRLQHEATHAEVFWSEAGDLVSQSPHSHPSAHWVAPDKYLQLSKHLGDYPIIIGYFPCRLDLICPMTAAMLKPTSHPPRLCPRSQMCQWSLRIL